MVDPYQVSYVVGGAKRDPGDLAIRSAFSNPQLPLVIDIGCAQGRFILQLAKTNGDAGHQYNYIGFELRETLVGAANEVVLGSELNGKVMFIKGEAKSILREALTPLLNPSNTEGTVAHPTTKHSETSL